ncbi:MAG: DUF4838 domain-containing protein [Chitinophagaceae bacterium]
MPVKFLSLIHLLAILLLSSNVHCQVSKGKLSLVENRKSAYNIVLPDEASRAEQKAAGILQDYIRKISGSIVPVIAESSFQEPGAGVFIGKTQHTLQWNRQPVKGEGFDIRTIGKNLYITGGNGQGVVYGVYTFLEKYLGCRKYAAGPAFVPNNPDISIPVISEREIPSFVFRQVFYPESNDPEYLAWHKLHQFEDLWGLWGHSFFKIIPPGTYFNTHPEYFAEVDGKRQPSQLCLSNNAVLDLTVSYLRKAITANPDALYWSIGQEDGGVFCTCSSCSEVYEAEGGHAGNLVRFLNKVAARFPEQYFTTLAYGPTSKAPRQTAPAQNVFILLSNIDVYREESLEKAPSASAFRKDVDGWKHLSAQLFIWDYTTQFTNYLSPFPAYLHAAANMRYYQRNQVKGAFVQGSGDGFGDMSEWNSYLYAALLWNPAANQDSLFRDFTNGYYGKAAEEVRRYVSALAQQVTETKARLDIYGSPIASSRDYLSPEGVQRLSELLLLAERKAGDDTTLQKRLTKLRLPLEYTVLEQSKFFGLEPYGFIETAHDHNIRKEWPEKVRSFTQHAKQSGITEISEGGKNPDEYLKSWEQLFDRMARPLPLSKAFRKPVVLTNPYTPEYSLKKERTLTDGLFGTEDFSFNWLFTYGNDMIATIDLEKETSLSSIQMNFLSDARHYIFLPTSIVVETSMNGKDFTTLGKEDIPAPEEDYTISIRPFSFQQNNTTARYIRVKAAVPNAVPSWRMAAVSRKPALCIDEVYVH